MKICDTCKKTKDVSDFNKNKTKKDGLNTICRTCSNETSKKYYLRNKAKHLKLVAIRRDEYKLLVKNKIAKIKSDSGGCLICPEKEICCLDFHHIHEKDKIIDISLTMRIGWCWERIQKEIDKCVIICSNCHRKLHAGIVKLPS